MVINPVPAAANDMTSLSAGSTIAKSVDAPESAGPIDASGSLGEPTSEETVTIGPSKRLNLNDLKKIAYEKAGGAADYLDDHATLRGAIGITEKVAKGLNVFPKFIYPTIKNMSSQEGQFVYQVLDTLPLRDVNSVKRVEMLAELPNASGMAYRNPAVPYIQLSRQQMNLSAEWAKTVNIHEVGHTKDYATAWFGLFGHESKNDAIWGQGPFISDYAKTNHWEDFAESYVNYHLNPEKLKQQCPEKFARIQELEKQGFFDSLIDRKSFRETGKYIGGLFDKAPFIRSGLNLFSYLIGFVQVAKGIGELGQAEASGSLRKEMNGNLDIAAGTCFATRLMCIPGMALDGAKQSLNRAIDKGEITELQAYTLVQSTIGVITGPLALAIRWIETKILRKKLPPAGGPQNQQVQQNPGTPRQEEITVGGLAKAASIAIGGGTGSVLGGMLGPYFGLQAGFNLAGPLGGALGLVAGCLVGIYAGNKVGGELGSLAGGFFEHKG